MKKIISENDRQTQRVGFDLAKRLEKGETFLLFGELGAGKTTFAKGFAKGLGVSNRIISPTFTIIRDFEVSKKDIKRLYHIDLYRLSSEEEVLALGITDLIKDPQNVILIEWPEKIGKYLPEKRVEINFKYEDDNKRRIFIK